MVAGHELNGHGHKGRCIVVIIIRLLAFSRPWTGLLSRGIVIALVVYDVAIGSELRDVASVCFSRQQNGGGVGAG